MNIYGLIIDVLTALASSIEQVQMLTDENHIRNIISDEVNHTNKRRRRRKRSDDSRDDDDRPRKRRYIKYDRVRAYNCVMVDYFNPQPTFDDYQFERFFRITPSLAEYILRRLASNDEFWTLRYDCTKRMSNAPEVKLLAVLKMVVSVADNVLKDPLLSLLLFATTLGCRREQIDSIGSCRLL